MIVPVELGEQYASIRPQNRKDGTTASRVALLYFLLRLFYKLLFLRFIFQKL